MGLLWIKSLTMTAGHANVIGHLDRVLELMSHGVLDPSTLVTHHRKLTDAPEAYELYDKRDMWGTEARAFAGNFLYSTGANEHAGRFTAGHFDLPMRGCTVRLDDRVVVDGGELVRDLRA